MALALDAGVSTRHLSFVETGRAHASRALLLDLCDHLDVPLRERNVLLLAAGFAPSYTESALDAAGLEEVRTALEHLLAGHEPYPALAVDRCGDVVMTNRAVGVLLAALDPTMLAPPVNIYRLSLHPEGLARHIHNRAQWSTHLLHRLDRLVDLTGDPRLVSLRAEVGAWVDGWVQPAAEPVIDRAAHLLLPLHLTHPQHGELRFHSTITHFGAAWDVTLDELSIESFVPADTVTRETMARLASPW